MKIEVDKNLLHKLYVCDQLSMRKTGELLGVSPVTVFNRLNEYGIATRSHEETFTFKGKKHSKSSLEKMSKFQKGKTITDETRAKMSDAKKQGGIGHKKKRSDGYVFIYFPDHPMSTKDGYVMEHDLVMEALIGRHLKGNECVHHINEIRDDNRKENLMLMTKSEHMSLHSKKRWEKRRNDLSIV